VKQSETKNIGNKIKRKNTVLISLWLEAKYLKRKEAKTKVLCERAKQIWFHFVSLRSKKIFLAKPVHPNTKGFSKYSLRTAAIFKRTLSLTVESALVYNFVLKGSVQQKQRWVENVVTRSVGASDCGAGHSFVVLFGFHIDFTIFPFPVSTT
jgi:hypothetical protein